MFRNATLAVVMGLAVSGMAAAQQVLTPEQAIPNQYIVVFDDVQVARTQVAEQRHAEQGHRGRHRLAESPPLLAVRRRIANRSSTDRRLHLRLYRADLHVRWQRIDGRCRDRHLQLELRGRAGRLRRDRHSRVWRRRHVHRGSDGHRYREAAGHGIEVDHRHGHRRSLHELH
jgi:hypothetical protein